MDNTITMIWRDGVICGEAPLCLPPAEVNGVMTTIGCDRGRLLLWEKHRRRLLSYKGLGPTFDENILPRQKDLESLLEASRCLSPARLRVSVWMDSSSQTLRAEAVCSSVESFGPQQEPVWLGVISWDDPPALGDKIIARQKWHDACESAVSWGADDALIADGNGRILETSKANVFVRRGLVVATPPAPDCCLPGILRAEMLISLPAGGLRVEERDVYLDELTFADEVWVTNAVIGVVRVGRVGERRWDRWDFFRKLVDMPIAAPGWA